MFHVYPFFHLSYRYAFRSLFRRCLNEIDDTGGACKAMMVSEMFVDKVLLGDTWWCWDR